ncbi:hypothetical protein [Klebsiella aerogenes]|uniref:hypothetical protein n=1 Tax=Klebsiella aerogenes TaxID=548 RepID=UPI002FEE88E1
MASHQCSIFSAYLILLICPVKNGGITKAIRFGLEEIQPGQALTNAQRLALELDDLYGAIELLNEKHPGTYIPNRDNINAKKAKIAKFMKYSEQCGTVVLDTDGDEQ